MTVNRRAASSAPSAALLSQSNARPATFVALSARRDRPEYNQSLLQLFDLGCRDEFRADRSSLRSARGLVAPRLQSAPQPRRLHHALYDCLSRSQPLRRSRPTPIIESRAPLTADDSQHFAHRCFLPVYWWWVAPNSRQLLHHDAVALDLVQIELDRGGRLCRATSGASTVPRISPLARSRTTRQRRSCAWRAWRVSPWRCGGGGMAR